MSTKTPKSSAFIPKPTGKAYWRHRISHILNSFRTRPGRTIFLGLSVYLVAFNAGMRWWRGPDEPINRLQWQLRKSRGELSREALEKEDTIYRYYKTKFNNTNNSFPQID